MTYGLPAHGEASWDTKLVDSIVAVKATADGSVQKWAPNTAYTAGDTRLAPDGSLVKAKTTFTSGASYSSSNWTTVAAYAGTQAASELVSNLPSTYAASRLAYTSGRGAFMGLKKFLEGQAGHATLHVLGDSTAGLTGNWVRDVADWFAAQNVNLGVRYRTVDQTTGAFNAPTTIQAGTKGTPQVALSNVADSFAFATNAGNFTNDIDIAVKVQPSAWPLAATGVLAARANGAPNLGWLFYLTNASQMQFQWSKDGTATMASVTSGAITLSTSSPSWVRVTAVKSGSDVVVSFYTGTDGFTWTQVGTSSTQVGWAPVFQPASVKTSFGAWGVDSGGGSSRLTGTIFETWVRNGVGGPTIADTQPGDWALGAGATRTPGWLLDVVNAGWSGRTLNDLTVNAPALTPHMGSIATVLCCGHNDSTWSGSYYASLLNSWRDAVLARSPNGALIVTAQNPRVPPATNIGDHAARHSVLAGWANRNGAGLLDVYSLFEDDSRYTGANTSTLYNSDLGGVHPSPTGWQLWADLFTAAVSAGL